MNPRHMLLLAALATVALYGVNVGDFFFHDSMRTVANNPGIRISGASLEDWRTSAMSTNTGPLGRPLSMLSFAANHAISGEVDAVAIKVTNIGLHVLTGILLWLFLSLVLQRSPLLELGRERAQLIAAVAAAIWLLHPLQVSTVMYTVQRMTQLAALFTFAGLFHLVYLRAKWLESPPSVADYSRVLLAGLIWTVLAALSKENGLLLPLLAAVIELTLFRFRVSGGRSQVLRFTVLGSLAASILILVVLPVAFSDLFRDWYAQRPYTLGERLLTQPRLLLIYLGWIYLPDVTAMGFHHDDIALSRGLFAPVSTGLALIAFAVLTAVAWWQRNRTPLLGFALLWFIVGHLMESSIIPLELSYEHRNYLPSIGPMLLLAAVPLQMTGASSRLAKAGLALFVIALVPLLYLRGTAWTSELQLTETLYRNHPDSPKTGFNLAIAYYDEARTQRDTNAAQQYFSASRLAAANIVDRYPDYVPALVWLIQIDSHSSDSSRLAEWHSRLAAALEKPVLYRSDMRSIVSLNNCIIAARCAQPEGGQEAFLRRLAERHPEQLHLRIELAKYCMTAGRPDCAREEAERVLAVEPRFFMALEILYQVQMSEEQPGQALETARRLMKVDRERLMARSLLGHGGVAAP